MIDVLNIVIEILTFVIGAFLPFMPMKKVIMVCAPIVLVFFYHDISSYQRIFVFTFGIITSIGMIYSLNDFNPKVVGIIFFYFGSAVGAVVSGGLLDFLIHWELLAYMAIILLFFSDFKATMQYAVTHLCGGTCLLAGVAGQIYFLGSDHFHHYTISSLQDIYNNRFAFFMLVGILINCAIFPFSYWIPNSYPKSSSYGTVFLASFTTKVAIYMLVAMFHGSHILIPLGMITAIYSIIYAILTPDIQRSLSYALVTQLGIMVIGIGIGGNIAVAGAILHAIACVFYQGLLFMVSGANESKIGDKLRGNAMSIAALVGAASASAFPLTSGFIGKSLVLTAVEDYNMVCWVLLLMVNVGLFFLLLRFALHVARCQHEVPWNVKVAVIMTAAICILIGVFYRYLYDLLPQAIDLSPYSPMHVVMQLQLFAVGLALAIFCKVPWFKLRDVDYIFDKIGEIGGAIAMIDVWLRSRFCVYREILCEQVEKISLINMSIGDTISVSVVFIVLVLACLIP